jgi:hypothetical protein
MAEAASAYGKLCGMGGCPPGNNPLTVILDGPFSIILQAASAASDVINGVVAFTPIEKNGKHLFNLNGVPLTDIKHDFDLKISGFTPTNKPCIIGLDGFCTDHTKWDSSPAKRFITLVLPPPNRIRTTRNSIPVTVAGKTVNLPQNHVLEYDTTLQSVPKMGYKGKTVSPVANTYILEVGMDPAVDPDTDCSHALQFYNESMLPLFPDLGKNVIQKFNQCPKFKGHLYAQRRSAQGEGGTHILTTTLECKSGGLLVSTP